jgi:glycosyltransferase 2 family protein
MKISPGKTSKIKLYAGWFLSAVFVFFVFRDIEWKEFFALLKKISPGEILMLVVLYLLGFVVRGIRTRVMLPSLSLSDSLGGVLIGYAANNVLPARLGEVARAHIVGRKCNIKRSTTLSSIFVERIFDGFAIVILLCIGTFQLSLPSWAVQFRNLGLFVFSLGLLTVILSGMYSNKLVRFFNEGRLRVIFVGLMEGVTLATRNVYTVILIVFLSFVIWATEATMFYYGFLIFGFSISLLGAFFVLGVINLAVLIPNSPGNLGVFQYFTVLALSVFGVVHTEATVYSLLIHLCQLIPVTIIGFLLLPKFGMESLSEVSTAEGDI